MIRITRDITIEHRLVNEGSIILDEYEISTLAASCRSAVGYWEANIKYWEKSVKDFPGKGYEAGIKMAEENIKLHKDMAVKLEEALS